MENIMQKPMRLFNRNYLLLWQGQTVSRLGNQVFTMAMILWITETTGSKSLLGLLGMVGGIPAVLLGAFGGTFADRFSRRKIIVWSDALNGISILGLAYFFFFTPHNIDLLVVLLFAVSVVSAVIGSFFQPAISASIPDIVPEGKIQQANSFGQLSIQMSVIFGQSLGSFLFTILGAPILVLVNGISFLFSAFSEIFIKIPQKFPEKTESLIEKKEAFKRDFIEGFVFIWSQKGLKKLVFASVLLSFFTMPILVLLPFYVQDALQVKVYWVGFITSAYGIGSLMGYLMAGLLPFRGSQRARFMLVMMILGSLIYSVLGFATGPVFATIVFVLAGIMGGIIQVNILTILQISTPTQIRGRVFGFLTTISGSIAPLGMGLGGVVAGVSGINIPLIYISCGIIMAILATMFILNSDTINYLSFEKGEDKPTVRGAGQILLQTLQHQQGEGYHNAVHVLSRALMENRKDEAVLYKLGVVNYEMESYEEALWYLNELLDSYPENIPALLLTATNYAALEDYNSAEALLNKILEIEPLQKDALINLAVIALQRKDHTRSIQFFTKVTENYPDEIKGYIGLAQNYMLLEDPEESGKYFEKAKSLKTDGFELTNLIQINLYNEKIESENSDF